MFSAPYPGNAGDDPVHDWKLHQPSDILQVYFLIRNIDIWTVGKFRERAITCVSNTAKAMEEKDLKYEPWKRVGDLIPPVFSRRHKENTTISTGTDFSLSTPEMKGKKGKGRRR